MIQNNTFSDAAKDENLDTTKSRLLGIAKRMLHVTLSNDSLRTI